MKCDDQLNQQACTDYSPYCNICIRSKQGSDIMSSIQRTCKRDMKRYLMVGEGLGEGDDERVPSA